MPSGTSLITDQRYFAVHRDEEKVLVDPAKRFHDDCVDLMSKAPQPSNKMKPKGRRPHKHNDKEGLFEDERRAMDGHTERLKQGKAIVDPKKKAPLAAYPDRPFDYVGQNKDGKDGNAAAGYGRVVTDKNKNIVGMAYHPVGDKMGFVRAPAQGAFIADYRCDSFKVEKPASEKGKKPPRGSATWPRM